MRTRIIAIIAVTAVMVSAATVLVKTQRYTIPELAAASDKKTITMTMMEEDRLVPVTNLSAASDIVVYAKLVHPRSYLSDDKTMIYTDYEIVPIRVIRSKITNVGQSPGPLQLLLLTVNGGEITLDGKTVTLTSGKLKPIRSGGRFLIFASRTKQGVNRLEATGGSAGIFEILEDGRVDPLLKTSESNQDIEGISLEDIARKVQSVPR